jgi:anti-sigma factor (TIGR02949 family)
MTCEEAFRRLDDYLDRALAPEEVKQLERHLSVCSDCAREFGFEANVMQELKRKLGRVAAPPGLKSRIFRNLPPDAGGGQSG